MKAEADPFTEAHNAAVAHLDACDDALERLEACGDALDESDSPASFPYCGCRTCEVREALHAAWPLLRRAALAGYPEGDAP